MNTRLSSVIPTPTSGQWRQVRDFPDYLVDDQGNVMNAWTQHILRPRYNQQGFAMVNFIKNRKLITRSTAIIVGQAYLEDPPSEAYNSIINLNGDRADCRAMNLMWRPRWFAIRYRKMFDREPFRVGVYIPSIRKRFTSLREFCTTYGLVEMDTYLAIENREPCFHYGWLIERLDQ